MHLTPSHCCNNLWHSVANGLHLSIGYRSEQRRLQFIFQCQAPENSLISFVICMPVGVNGKGQRQWQVGGGWVKKGNRGQQGNRGKLGTVCAEHAAPHSAALTETLANFHWCAALFVISGQPFSIAMHFGHFYIFAWFLFALAFTFTFAFAFAIRVVFLVARRVARFAARLCL